MQRYGNQSGDSGVIAYEAGSDFIIVQFRGGATYRYDHLSAGVEAVEQMKQMAKAGKGLSTFISQNVSNKYASKLQSASLLTE